MAPHAWLPRRPQCDHTEASVPTGDRKLNWYFAALRKYAVFHGRARRKEFWYFFLFFVIFVWLAMFLDVVLGTFSMELETGLLSGCFSVAMAVPYVAVSVRRLHDTDRSGWWFLIQLIPIVGTIWYLVLLVLDGQPGENRFGSDPKLDTP